MLLLYFILFMYIYSYEKLCFIFLTSYISKWHVAFLKNNKENKNKLVGMVYIGFKHRSINQSKNIGFLILLSNPIQLKGQSDKNWIDLH